MVLFLAVFYFTFGVFVERKVVDQQMEEIASTFTNNLVILPPDTREKVKKAIQNIDPPDMKSEDERVSRSNKKLMKKAFIVMGVIAIIGITLVGTLWWFSDGNRGFFRSFSLTNLLLENGAILLLVAATEAAFAWFILRNYRSADPHVVMRELVKQVKEYGQKCDPI